MRKFLAIPLILPVLLLSGCQTSQQDLANISNILLGGQTQNTGALGSITNQDIIIAFRQALTIDTGEVVQQLGQTNGFNLDPKVRIPLPSKLQQVQSALNTVGMGYLFDDLELRMNRAAEIATPHAKQLFTDAISEMTFSDAIEIYKGPQDSATRYFQSKMSAPLSDKMRPFISQAMAQAGVVQAYDSIMANYKAIPFMPDVKADLTNYVLDEGINGIFYYLGEQEKQIRQDPLRQTTAILKKVFGSTS